MQFLLSTLPTDDNKYLVKLLINLMTNSHGSDCLLVVHYTQNYIILNIRLWDLSLIKHLSLKETSKEDFNEKLTILYINDIAKSFAKKYSQYWLVVI